MKFIPNAVNCSTGQSLHIHDGLTETQIALPSRWKRDSPLSCIIGSDVDILLMDRAAHRDGPVVGEGAAPGHDIGVVADMPGMRNRKLSRVRTMKLMVRRPSETCKRVHTCVHISLQVSPAASDT